LQVSTLATLRLGVSPPPHCTNHRLGHHSLTLSYDYPTCRRALRRRGITPRVARRGVESRQRLGRHRWKVERSLAWLLANRRLTVRYERRADILTAFLHLACALICARKLQPLWTTAYEAGLP
jgi:transposase